jgi:hypothetical protein
MGSRSQSCSEAGHWSMRRRCGHNTKVRAVPPPPLRRRNLRPERSAQCLPPLSLVLVCVGAAAAGVLSGTWYGFAVAPRGTSSGHARHVCATGAVASCAPRRCALGQTRSGLAPGGLGRRAATQERCGENSRQCFIPGGGAAATGGQEGAAEKDNGF